MIYRRPHSYAQHAARVIWQAQPSWEFTGVPGILEWIETTGTFVSDTVLYGTEDVQEWVGTAGLISFPRTVDGIAGLHEWFGSLGDVDSEPLTIPTTLFRVSTDRNRMTGRTERNRMTARVS